MPSYTPVPDSDASSSRSSSPSSEASLSRSSSPTPDQRPAQGGVHLATFAKFFGLDPAKARITQRHEAYGNVPAHLHIIRSEEDRQEIEVYEDDLLAMVEAAIPHADKERMRQIERQQAEEERLRLEEEELQRLQLEAERLMQIEDLLFVLEETRLKLEELGVTVSSFGPSADDEIDEEQSDEEDLLETQIDEYASSEEMEEEYAASVDSSADYEQEDEEGDYYYRHPSM